MSPASASAEKTERLLNLILALKSARRPVSKQKIRESLPAYAAATSDEAFDRMFERDKDELREMGIPITTTVLDVLFDDEVGYRIDSSETTLPAISFEPDEVAALALAARAWSTASISGAASAGLRKLRLSGVEIDESVAAGAEPRIRTKEPAFEAVHAALSALQPITFDYRKNDGELTTRRVQPWALKNWHGRWYLTGYDLDRDDDRAFRLSRFEGTVRKLGRPGTYAVPDGYEPDVALEQQATAPVGTARRAAAPRARAHPPASCPVGDRARRALVGGGGALLARLDRARRRGPRPARRRRLAARARRRGPLDARRRGRGQREDVVMTAARSARRPQETATQRLGRLLDMVPWLLQHRGVPIEEAASEFGVSREQIVEDLELLFVCGTPGYGHAELIDASWESGHVYLDNADDIAAPMRLTRDEAVTLTAGLQALGASLVGSDVAERTLAKLRAAAATTVDADRGPHRARPRRRQPAPGDGHAQGRLCPQAAGAPALLRRTRDESTERDVDIMRIVNLDGQWYVEGWCHRAQGVRLFRLDRIERAEVLEVDGTPPAQARPRDLDDVFVPGENDLTVVLEASRWAAWIADYYPNEGVERGPDGSLRVTLKVADPALVRRLVLRLGGEVRVAEPAELAQAVAHEARAALAAYDRLDT